MLMQRVADQVLGTAAQNADGRFVDFPQHAVGIQRQHGVVHAVQDGLVVVALGTDLLEQLRILDGYGGLRREGPQPPFVGAAKHAALAIQYLHHAYPALAPGENRHAQQAVGAVAGVPVELRVETGIAVGVANVDHAAGTEAFPGDTRICREANLLAANTAGDTRKQFVTGGVVEKQGAAVGFEQRGRRRHDFGQQRIEVDLGDDRDAYFQQHGFLALLAFDFLEQARVFECRRGLQRQPFKQPLVFAVEVADMLVQRLGDADHFAVLVADRDAENIPGAVAGAPVDLLIEARVGIHIGDDFGLAAGEHRTGDAEVAGEANFADDIALHDPREQLICLRIEKKE